MSVPDWYALVLLSLASFRTWRLLAEDDIMDRPRRYLTRLGDWEEADEDKPSPPWPAGYRVQVAKFINCPWCLGFWISLAWWGMWEWLPHETLVVASAAAISAVVGLIGKTSTS